MKFTDDNLPSLAQRYRGTKRAEFIDAANEAFDVLGDEATAIFAGMIAADEERNATSRALILKQQTELDAARIFVKQRVKMGKNNTLDAEIFAIGTWNKVWKFTANDLDQIVASFNALAPDFKVPLKFGHNDKQPFTDGQPALGWVTHVWRKGEKLMGRFEHVPDVVMGLIKQKSYRKVSIELDVDVQDRAGRKHKYVLSAVALLGADRPAVSTLADLDTYVDNSASLFTASSREVFSVINGNRSQEDDMTPDEVQAAIEKAMKPLNEQITAVSKENETLKAENAKFKASAEEADKKAKESNIKLHRDKLTAKFEAAVKANTITPAQREMGVKFMRIDQDDSVLSVTEQSVDDYIKVNGGKIKMSNNERGHQGGGTDRVEADPGAEVVRRAEERRAENPKLSFAQARDLVLRADPELAKEWMEVPQEDAA